MTNSKPTNMRNAPKNDLSYAMRARPVRPMPRNSTTSPQKVTGGASHPATGEVDTPGKRGEENDAKAYAPPPPGGREVLTSETAVSELMQKKLAGLIPLWSQTSATVPTAIPSPSSVPRHDSQDLPLPLNVARTPDQNPCATGMRGGGDGSVKSPSLPPSQARESALSNAIPSETNRSQSNAPFPGYAKCDVQNATAAEIANGISIQELGVSSLGSMTAIRDILLVSMRAKNKYRLGAEVTATLIDLCEMQLATLSMLGGQEGLAGRRRESGVAETVADRLDAMEKRILSAIGPKSMRETQTQSALTPSSSNPRNNRVRGGPHQPEPTSAPPPKPKHHHVVISLSGARDAAHLTGITPRQLSLRVQEAVRGCGIPSVEQMNVIGAQFTSKTRMKVFVSSDDEAHDLLQSANVWIPKLAPGAVLVVRTWSVVVHSVPTTFRPLNKSNLAYLYERNPEVTLRNLRNVRWLKEDVAKNKEKRESTLVLAFSDYEVAEEVVYQGLFLENALCKGDWYHKGPDLCYKCQGFGHRSYACPSPHSICARCAGHHPTQKCPCPHASPCQETKLCKINFKCARCDGPHCAFDRSCPLRKTAMQQAACSTYDSREYSSYHAN